jgi:hypothetical protein
MRRPSRDSKQTPTEYKHRSRPLHQTARHKKKLIPDRTERNSVSDGLRMTCADKGVSTVRNIHR